MKKIICLFACVAISGLATSSHASILDAGDGVPGNSWSGGLFYNGLTNIDTIEAFIVADSGGTGPFEAPGMGTFSNGWADGSLVLPTYALATGFADATFNGLLFYDGDISGDLEVDIFVWSGGVFGTLVASSKFSYANGSAVVLAVDDSTGVNYNRGAVPEPTGALIWIGLAIGATFVSRRRNTKR